MTDFEAATIAVQQTQAAHALWVGLGQVAVVALGMTAMLWEGIRRGKQYADHHAEAMTALKALIERSVPRSERQERDEP